MARDVLRIAVLGWAAWAALPIAAAVATWSEAPARQGATSELVIRVGSPAELARALTTASEEAGPTRIELRPGLYELSSPIVIGEDLARGQKLSIVAEERGRAVISGARSLPQLAWHAEGGGLWSARVDGASFQRLWLGERLLTRARYPNLPADGQRSSGRGADATSPSRIARWKDPRGGVIHALDARRWGGVHVPILGKRSDGTLLLGEGTGNNRGVDPSESDRFVENIREELDSPGEWFLDRGAGTLFVQMEAGRRPPASGFRAGALEGMLRIIGRKAPARRVLVRGLSFRDSEPTFQRTTEPLLRSDWRFHRGGAVLLENVEDVSIEDSDFSGLGGNGVVVSGHARRIGIRRNLFQDLGASAIAFVGRASAVRSALFDYDASAAMASIDRREGPRSDEYPADSVAEDNLIHDIGTIEKQVAGVEISMSARIVADHNTIYRTPRAGINIGDGTWGGHVISNNDVFLTVLETGDHGAFNSWGRDRYWDPHRKEMDRRVAAHPWLSTLDAREQIVLRHNRFRCDHGWDVDLDDGASNYLIEDNLLLAGGLKLREGFRRHVRNNVMLNNTLHPHVWFERSGDVVEHNVMLTAYQPILMRHWGSRLDHNLFANEADLLQARRLGLDAHSAWGSPRFVSPRSGDYSVQAGSPALAVGFRNFRMDDFGVRPTRLRSQAERPDFPEPVLAAPPGRREQPRQFAGMTIKSVETLGEQSAVGLPSKEGVIVLAVAAGGAASMAGLRPGDAIVGIADQAGVPGQRTATAAALVAAAQGRRWQSRIPLEVVRNQARLVVEMRLQ